MVAFIELILTDDAPTDFELEDKGSPFLCRIMILLVQPSLLPIDLYSNANYCRRASSGPISILPAMLITELPQKR